MKPGTILMVFVLLMGGVSNGRAQHSDQPHSIRYEDFDVSGDDSAIAKSPDWLVWSLSGLGVAGVGVGMALYSVGQSDEDMLLELGRDEDGRARGVTQRNAARIEGDLSERMNLGMGFMIGGAVLGGGAVLWYLYGQEDVERSRVPSENRVVPFGFVPRFELDVDRGGLQLSSSFVF
jgi:hypothetical protein